MCELDSCGVFKVCETLGYRIGRLSIHNYASFSNAPSRSLSPSKSKVRLSEIEPTVDDIDPDGPLFGKRVAFTGTLDSMTRNAAFQATVNSGGEPSTSVSKRTHFLVLGVADYSDVGADGMSAKMRKAVELKDSGAAIEIIDENDFLRMADPTAFS
jgi:DNA polymerase-3 subunit epsilon